MKPTVQKSRGGRPRLAEPRSTVSARLPVAVHDRLIQIARAQDQSVSATVRQLLILRLK
jgi:predicted HicB family RNase H-like nuclease